MIESTSEALTKNHPVRTAFMDETGTISVDRFFAVGALLLDEPSDIAGELRRTRDRLVWRHEWHLKEITKRTLPEYQAVVDALASCSGWSFEYIVLDRELTSIAKEESKYRTYELMAADLIRNATTGSELLVVLSDYYQMPAKYTFEKTVREAVNTSTGRLVVPVLLHVDSRTSDLIQVSDMLTSTFTFPFRAAAALASWNSVKGQFSRYARSKLGSPGIAPGQLRIHGYGRAAPEIPQLP
jgi:hypothetical protein